VRHYPPAILALDAAYGETQAAVAGVFFSDWAAEDRITAISKRSDGPPRSYEPGAFYKRELPLLLSIIDEVPPTAIATIIVDGYVWLGHEGQLGLGAHLYEAIHRRVPVVGVAKTKYRGDTWSLPVLRGASASPLYVTSAGVDCAIAAENVARMSGVGRTPKLISLADRWARSGLG